MVAAGQKSLGPAAAQTNNTQVVNPVSLKEIPHWSPRGGRNDQFLLWDDALSDVSTEMKLGRNTIYEETPRQPPLSLPVSLLALTTVLRRRAMSVHPDKNNNNISFEQANARTALLLDARNLIKAALKAASVKADLMKET